MNLWLEAKKGQGSLENDVCPGSSKYRKKKKGEG